MLHRSLTLLVLLAAAAASAQTPDQIAPRSNPAPASLRRIWESYGDASEKLGPVTSLPDINGDGVNEFGIYVGRDTGWTTVWQLRVYNGGEPPRASPAFALKDGVSYVATGDFRGDGVRTLVMRTSEFDSLTIDGTVDHREFPIWSLFRFGSGGIDSVPAATLDTRRGSSRTGLFSTSVKVADLDGDGTDELIVCSSRVYHHGSFEPEAQIWIYRGGPNFTLDTPSVVLHDDEIQFDYGAAMIVGRWDADSLPDIAVRNIYSGPIQRKWKFWLSSEGSPWSWTAPQRSVNVDDADFLALDCDGDGILDIAMSANGDSDWRARLYRSGEKGPLPFRTLGMYDADRTFYRHGHNLNLFGAGYLNDESKRYQMLAFWGDEGIARDTLTAWFFSGGPDGPDRLYDAILPGGIADGVTSLTDVTGDGWSDLALASFLHGDTTFAFIYAGGPYIPRDQPASGVQDLAVGALRNAISVWPTPMRDQLHIAWRGDLGHMPSRFTVHDLLGREIAWGDVVSSRGETSWNCTGVPAGVYILSVYDAGGSRLADARIVKP